MNDIALEEGYRKLAPSHTREIPERRVICDRAVKRTVKNEVINILEMGRDIIEKKGGSVGKFIDSQGRFCAWGAFIEVLKQLSYPSGKEEARRYLIQAARALYKEDVAWVNDEIGQEAVLRVYDYAIKLAKEDYE